MSMDAIVFDGVNLRVARAFFRMMGCDVVGCDGGAEHRWLVASECVNMGNLEPQPDANQSDGGGVGGSRLQTNGRTDPLR
jgi:hypothetical protein